MGHLLFLSAIMSWYFVLILSLASFIFDVLNPSSIFFVFLFHNVKSISIFSFLFSVFPPYRKVTFSVAGSTDFKSRITHLYTPQSVWVQDSIKSMHFIFQMLWSQSAPHIYSMSTFHKYSVSNKPFWFWSDLECIFLLHFW